MASPQPAGISAKKRKAPLSLLKAARKKKRIRKAAVVLLTTVRVKKTKTLVTLPA